MNWFKKLFSRNPRDNKPKVERDTSPLGDSPRSSSNPRDNKPKVEGAPANDRNARKPISSVLEVDVWFVLAHGKKKEGPFPLEQLRARLQGVSASSQLRIRKGTSGEWCAWANAGKVFPELAALGLVEASGSLESTTAKGTTQPPPARAARPPVVTAPVPGHSVEHEQAGDRASRQSGIVVRPPGWRPPTPSDEYFQRISEAPKSGTRELESVVQWLEMSLDAKHFVQMALSHGFIFDEENPITGLWLLGKEYRLILRAPLSMGGRIGTLYCAHLTSGSGLIAVVVDGKLLDRSLIKGLS